jgi:hypothetical protein
MAGITVGTTLTTIGIVRIVGIGIIAGITLTIGVGAATRLIRTTITTITTITTTTITTRTIHTTAIVRRMEDLHTTTTDLHTTTTDLHTQVLAVLVVPDITKLTVLVR